MIVASSSMTSMTSRRYLQSSMNHLTSWYDDEHVSLSGSIQLNCVNLFCTKNCLQVVDPPFIVKAVWEKYAEAARLLLKTGSETSYDGE